MYIKKPKNVFKMYNNAMPGTTIIIKKLKFSSAFVRFWHNAWEGKYKASNDKGNARVSKEKETNKNYKDLHFRWEKEFKSTSVTRFIYICIFHMLPPAQLKKDLK